MEINCESGSVIAATLANGGVCPTTGDQVMRHNEAVVLNDYSYLLLIRRK